MDVALSFNYHEAKILLNWFSNSRVKTERFGTTRYEFPQEEILVEKLQNPMLYTFYDTMDVEIMVGWMEKSLGPGFGGEKFYFPLEEEIYKKLKKAQNQNKKEIKNESEISRESAIAYADRLIFEKKLKNEEKQQETSRQQLLQQRLKEKKEQQKRKKLSYHIKTHLEKLFNLISKKQHQ